MKILILSVVVLVLYTSPYADYPYDSAYNFEGKALPDGSVCIGADKMQSFIKDASFGWKDYVCYRNGVECGRKLLDGKGSRITGPVGNIVCHKTDKEMAEENGVAYWYEEESTHCTIQVTTPSGSTYRETYEYWRGNCSDRQYQEEAIRQAKIKACKSSMKKTSEGSMYKYLDKCVEYSTDSTSYLRARKPCARSYQSPGGQTAPRPNSCGYGAHWTTDSSYAGF